MSYSYFPFTQNKYLQGWKYDARLLFMENTTTLENKVLIENVNKKLAELRLSKSWAASQLGITTEYMRKVLSGFSEISKKLKDRLCIFLEKLNEIDKILAA